MFSVLYILFIQVSSTCIPSTSSLLDYYNREVNPSSVDKKKSKALARKILERILGNLDKRIYNGSLEGAGSSATNTKVNKADEFDMNLHLKVGGIDVDRSSLVNYKFSDVEVCETYFFKLTSFLGHTEVLRLIAYWLSVGM